MDEEILEKRPSNPMESAMLILTALFLILSIGMSRVEVSEYLQGTVEAEYQTDAKDRILEKYKKDGSILKIKKKLPDERKKINDLISEESSSGSSGQ